MRRVKRGRLLESLVQKSAAMKQLRIFVLLTAALMVAPLVSAADFGIRGGRFNDADNKFIGAELLFDAGILNINPNVEYWLDTPDDVTAGTANLDVTFDVMSVGPLSPYIGAGVGIAYASVGDTSETDILGNLIGGVAFNLPSLKPYAQVKYFKSLDDEDSGDDDELSLAIGLRF
jgi:opacity protein-like surface antigen